MSRLLYGVGAVIVVAGLVMIGFGIPVNEFSLGNTLIAAGVTAATGGLIITALGVVVSQLQRLNESLETRTPLRSGRAVEMLDSARDIPTASRIPFPPKPKAEAPLREPPVAEPHFETQMPADTGPVAAETSADEALAAPSFAPTLRNPEEPPVTVEDDVSLSPPHPAAATARGLAGLGERSTASRPLPPPMGDAAMSRQNDQVGSRSETEWRPPEPAPPSTRKMPTYFDSMWPAEPKPAKSPAVDDSKPTTKAAVEPKIGVSPLQRPQAEAPARPASEPPRSVAILKSGVVDGMGYTLYVDGSIEAELPQGTLRFSSINELRSHLEKNS